MSKATDKQVRDLEIAHKAQFIDLVLANRLFLKLLGRLKGKSKDSREYKAVLSFAHTVEKLITSWYMRQRDFEVKAKVAPVSKDILKYFFDPKHEKDLFDQARRYISPQSYEEDTAFMNGIYGIGFIPLLIWAVIVIVAAYSAVKIVDETNTTAQEKGELLDKTKETLKELNVTGPQAAAIISSTQAQASDTGGGGLFGGGLVKTAGIALLAYFALTQLNKPKAAH